MKSKCSLKWRGFKYWLRRQAARMFELDPTIWPGKAKIDAVSWKEMHAAIAKARRYAEMDFEGEEVVVEKVEVFPGNVLFHLLFIERAKKPPLMYPYCSHKCRNKHAEMFRFVATTDAPVYFCRFCGKRTKGFPVPNDKRVVKP